LLRKKDTGCIEILQDLAFRDEDVEVRYYASKAMNFLAVGMKRPPVAEEVDANISRDRAREALRSPDPEDRLRCVQAIAKSEKPDFLDILREAAATETDPLVRSALPLAISIIGSADDINLIVTRFINDANARVRANAIEALGRIGDKRAYPFIIGFLQDKDNRVRTNAALALNKFGKVNLVQTLQEMLYQPQVWMRDSAAFALQVIKIPEAIPLLEMAIQDSYLGVRLKAKKALQGLLVKGITEAQAVLDKYGNFQEEERVEDFLKLAEELDNADPMLAQQKRLANTLDPKDSYDFEALDSDKRIAEILRAAANEDLAVAPVLLRWLSTEADKKVKATIVSALGQLKYKAAMEPLMECLADRDPRIRANAVEALARFGDDKAYSKIMAMLKNSNNRVLANAILALDTYPYVNIIPHLERLAMSPKPEHRSSALWVIGKMRTLQTLPSLERLLSDQDMQIREKARDLLKELARDEGNFRARTLAKENGIRI